MTATRPSSLFHLIGVNQLSEEPQQARSVARKIGLLPHMRWLAGHSFPATLVLCWLVSPTMILVIAVLGEGRVPSFALKDQFLSFFPGDLFLGTMMAVLLWLAGRLPDERRWYNSWPWHLAVQALTLYGAHALIGSETKQGYYTSGQMHSASKYYHHYFLYGVYGYAIIVTLIAVLFGSAYLQQWFVALLALAILPGVIWASFVYRDATLSPAQARPLAANAHPTHSTPFWRGSVWVRSIERSLDR